MNSDTKVEIHAILILLCFSLIFQSTHFFRRKSIISRSKRSTMANQNRSADFDLPTSRKYIINHPVTFMADLHSAGKEIAPTWTKVSKTAWRDKAVLCGGYGRRMMNTSISSDAPAFFMNPEKVPPPNNKMTDMEASVTRKQKADPLAASKVLPGGG